MKYFIAYIIPSNEHIYARRIKEWNVTEEYYWGEGYHTSKISLKTLGKELSLMKGDVFYFESKEEAKKIAKFIKVHDPLEDIEDGLNAALKTCEQYDTEFYIVSADGKMEIV
jgi:hypothetical protein